MTDQNNSGNNPAPAQAPTQQIPTSSNGWNNIIFTGGTTGVNTNGQWITYTITGVDLGGGLTITQAEKKEEKKAKKKPEEDGCVCKKCKEFYPYAEPNQEDGTLVCYSCRRGY